MGVRLCGYVVRTLVDSGRWSAGRVSGKTSREADDKHNEATQARHQTIILVRSRESTMRNQETNCEIWKLGVKEGVGIVGMQQTERH